MFSSNIHLKGITFDYPLPFLNNSTPLGLQLMIKLEEGHTRPVNHRLKALDNSIVFSIRIKTNTYPTY